MTGWLAVAEVAAEAASALSEARRIAHAIGKGQVDGDTITVTVESTAIRSVSYNTKTAMMVVTFISSGDYDYPDMSEDKFIGLVTAPSVGRYYAQNIKGS